MKIHAAAVRKGSARPDLVALLVPDGRGGDPDGPLGDAVATARKTGDVRTGFREMTRFHPDGAGTPKRLVTLGAGKKADMSTDRLRRLAALARQAGELSKVKKMVLHVSEVARGNLDGAAAARAVAEGLVLGGYRYDKPSKTKPKPMHVGDVQVEMPGVTPKVLKAGLALGQVGAEATAFTRDVENRGGNLCTPTFLANEAKKFAKPGLKVTVLEEAQMKRLKMNALLGVSRGSREPAKLIVMDHNPRGAKKTIAVVGKGLTFDAGGISIKPSARMDEMRYDMCGGGAVLGLFHAIANGGLAGAKDNVRIVGVIAASENLPDGDAQKPGDVVTAMNGTTIEILNTDAEGRLILADALAYTVDKYQPDQMVDLATLTGAVVVALGHEMAGVMGSDDKLIAALQEAGGACDEPLWRLPLWEVHKKQIESRYADIANLNGAGHGNGSTAGGAFLSHFVGDTPWAHIDIAGAAWGAVAKDYYKVGATGTAVRTLLEWVRSHKG